MTWRPRSPLEPEREVEALNAVLTGAVAVLFPAASGLLREAT